VFFLLLTLVWSAIVYLQRRVVSPTECARCPPCPLGKIHSSSPPLSWSLPRVMETPAIPARPPMPPWLPLRNRVTLNGLRPALSARYVRLVHGVSAGRAFVQTEVEDLCRTSSCRAAPSPFRDLRDAFAGSAPGLRHHLRGISLRDHQPSCANATGESHRLGGPRRTNR